MKPWCMVNQHFKISIINVTVSKLSAIINSSFTNMLYNSTYSVILEKVRN